MATESQIAANRENAQSSTGATTETGKAASSRNAITLGLFTQADYVRPEERGLYNEHCETLCTELSPEGLLEATFADEIAGATWRLRRCSAAEANLDGFDEPTDKIRRSVERARSNAHSVLHRSVNQLRRLQTERACRAVLNAAGDDAGLADYQQVVVAANNYERGKHLHAKSGEIMMNNLGPSQTKGPGLRPGSLVPTERFSQNEASGQLASICKTPELPDSSPAEAAALASICKTTPRNAPCPCNSGQKYKTCCARTGAGWPTLAA